jgi:hypothetical protein
MTKSTIEDKLLLGALVVGGIAGYKVGKKIAEKSELANEYPKTTKTATTVAGAYLAARIASKFLYD